MLSLRDPKLWYSEEAGDSKCYSYWNPYGEGEVLYQKEAPAEAFLTISQPVSFLSPTPIPEGSQDALAFHGHQDSLKRSPNTTGQPSNVYNGSRRWRLDYVLSCRGAFGTCLAKLVSPSHTVPGKYVVILVAQFNWSKSPGSYSTRLKDKIIVTL